MAQDNWINNKWRPAMGWMYMVVCVTDFIIFPVIWTATQALVGHQALTQWDPLTLKGSGLFHVAMGAVLGITAFGRTKEKLSNPINSTEESN